MAEICLWGHYKCSSKFKHVNQSFCPYLEFKCYDIHFTHPTILVVQSTLKDHSFTLEFIFQHFYFLENEGPSGCVIWLMIECSLYSYSYWEKQKKKRLADSTNSLKCICNFHEGKEGFNICRACYQCLHHLCGTTCLLLPCWLISGLKI